LLTTSAAHDHKDGNGGAYCQALKEKTLQEEGEGGKSKINVLEGFSDNGV